MTPVRVSIVGAIASILLILVVLELVRGRRLKERYALLWLATGVGLQRMLVSPRRLRIFNIATGSILASSVLWFLW